MRALAPETRQALRDRVVRPCVLFDYDHPADRLRLWTGHSPIDWDGFEWKPSSILLQVTAVEQSTELQVSTVEFTLAGIKLSDEARALVLVPVRRVPTLMYRALLDRRSQVIKDPVLWFGGYGDPPRLRDEADGTSTIAVTARGKIENLVRPRRSLLSHNEQQKRFSDDTGLRLQAKVAESQVEWTIGPYNGFSPS